MMYLNINNKYDFNFIFIELLMKLNVHKHLDMNNSRKK
jgi:hypothetical protein